jgi:hypothetical protein
MNILFYYSLQTWTSFGSVYLWDLPVLHLFYLLFLYERKNERTVSLSLSVSKKGEAHPPLRQYMMDGDFFIGAALGTTLAKLALRYMSLTPDIKKQNCFCSEAMLIMASVLHLGKSGK